MRDTPAKPRSVKLLVLDLDDTLWRGTLLEGDEVTLRPGIAALLGILDQRGILLSVASRNDSEAALAKLEELGVRHFFLYPQIGWSAKSQGIKRLAEVINIGLDAVAFVDDQPFERAEVGQALPEVLLLAPDDLETLADRPEFVPRFVTDESAIRRQMYQADAERNRAQEEFVGPEESFLASLQMEFTIARAREEDLKRAEELTLRTNQLNSTGVTFSYEELDELCRSPNHLLLVASLVDRFGTYGKIGLALVELGSEAWYLRLLLMSCRVMSRGVGSILVSYLLSSAKQAGVRFLADFCDTGRNRMMKVTYRFAGFREVTRRGEILELEHNLTEIPAIPEYVRFIGVDGKDLT